MGSMFLRMFFDKRELHRQLLEMDREEEEEKRQINQQNMNNKIFLEDVKKRMDNMEKTLEILTNDSRLKEVVEREVERLNELRNATECFKKYHKIT